MSINKEILDQIKENAEYPLTDIHIEFQEKKIKIEMIYQTKKDKNVLTLDFERVKKDSIDELIDTLRQILTVNEITRQ